MVYVSNIEKTRDPAVPVRTHLDLRGKHMHGAEEETEYISLFFREDDDAAHAAWVFAIPKGADLADVLPIRSDGMELADDECRRAYSSFLVRLWQASSKIVLNLVDADLGRRLGMKAAEQRKNLSRRLGMNAAEQRKNLAMPYWCQERQETRRSR